MLLITDADTAALRQISSYYKKVTLYMKFGQLVLRKIIEIFAATCHILSQKALNSISAGASPQTTLKELTVLSRPCNWI